MTKDRGCPVVALAIVLLLPVLVACGTSSTSVPRQPTHTLAPPQTPRPTHTPTPLPTPTEAPPDVQEAALVVLQHTSYKDSGGNVHVVGQVYNNTAQHLVGVRVNARFYGQEAELLAEQQAYAYAEILPPARRAPFAITLFDVAEAPATYELEVSGEETDAPSFQTLEVVQHTLVQEERRASIAGEIRNAGDQPASKVRIAATFYDAEGQIIDVAFSFAQRNIVAPGAHVPFEIRTRAANGTPDHYRVTAFGDHASPEELDRQAALEILSTHAYRDDLNDLVVIGEVRNAGETNAAWPKLLISFYDREQRLIAARWGYAWAEILAPQATSPFRVRLLQTPAGVESWTVQVEGDKTEEEAAGHLALEEEQNAIDADSVTTFTGRVVNQGTETMAQIAIAVTIYDANGSVRAVGSSLLDGALAPGERAPFALQVQVPQDAQAFKLAVQGKASP